MKQSINGRVLTVAAAFERQRLAIQERPARITKQVCADNKKMGHLPVAMVVPTPFKLLRLFKADSRLGNLRRAFRVSVATALGVLIITRLII